MYRDSVELGGIAFFIVLIIAIVQWLLLRFTHWSIALGATAFIALFITSIYVSLSNASPNGGGSGPNVSEFVTPMLVIFASLLGGFFLVAYFSKIQLPKAAMLSVACFILVFVIYYVYQYVSNAKQYQELFSSCKMEVVNNSGDSLVTEIAINNSSNSLTISLNPRESQQPYSVIPRDSNTLIFTCYTDKNGMLRQEFPFDYSLVKEKNGKTMGLCFWLREKIALPIKIVLQTENKVDLYINNQFVQTYQLTGKNISKPNEHKGKYK